MMPVYIGKRLQSTPWRKYPIPDAGCAEFDHLLDWAIYVLISIGQGSGGSFHTL